MGQVDENWQSIKSFLFDIDEDGGLLNKFQTFLSNFKRSFKSIKIIHISEPNQNRNSLEFAIFWPQSKSVSNILKKKRNRVHILDSSDDELSKKKIINIEEIFRKKCFVRLSRDNLDELKRVYVQQILFKNTRHLSFSESSSSLSSDSSSSSDEISKFENIKFKKRYRHSKKQKKSKRRKKVPNLARRHIHSDSNESDSFYDSEIEKIETIDNNENLETDNSVSISSPQNEEIELNGVVMSSGSDTENENKARQKAIKCIKDDLSTKIKEKDKENSEPKKVNTNDTSALWRNDPLLRIRIDNDNEHPEKHKDKDVSRKTTKRIRDCISDSDENSNKLISSRRRRERIYDSSSDDSSLESAVNGERVDNSSKLHGIHNGHTDDNFRNHNKAVNSNTNSINSNLLMNNSRKNIRKIISDRDLQKSTKNVIELEKKRIKRLTERRKKMEEELKNFNNLFERDSILEYDFERKVPLVKIDVNLMKQLKEHQVDGIRFMWDSCFESIEMIEKSRGSGCVLAHYMGLGKTFQVVALIHALFTRPETNIKRVLVVCPVTTLHSWHCEFLNKFNQAKRKFDLRVYKLMRQNAVSHIKSWWVHNGVMLSSYEMLSNIFLKTTKDDSEKDLFNAYNMYLMNTDLVICDEGHFIKNIKNIRSKALLEIKTRRRIILTGTPIQNNLAEYFWMVNFVKPNYLGSFEEFTNRFINPIRNGQYENSTKYDIIVMKKRSYILHDMLKETVQRMNYDVLQKYLPSKYEYVMCLRMSELQRKLYNKFIDIIESHIPNGQINSFYKTALFANHQIMRMIWTHPYCLVLRTQDKNTINFVVEGTEKDQTVANINEYKQEEVIKLLLESIDKNELEILENGTKMKILMRIIKGSVCLKEKIIVFSSSRLELTCIEHFLEKCRYKYNVDYIRIDGRNTMADRQKQFKRFCNPLEEKLRILVCSKKVGGVGLTLLPANRVVLMDVEWNPAHDQQAVCRIYRFGQTKQCAVYRLVPSHTMEQVIYERSLTKMAVSHRVIDEHQICRHFNSTDLMKIYQRVPVVEIDYKIPLVPKDPVLAKIIKDFEKEIVQIKDYKSLLENLPEEELNDDDRRLAWEEYEKESSNTQLLKQQNKVMAITSTTTVTPHSNFTEIAKHVNSDDL